jgi:VPDSG-CTERM motif
MKTPSKIFAVCATFVCASALSAFATSFTVFGTGADNSGLVLPGGSSDPHYTVSGPGVSGTQQAVVYSAPNLWPQWLPNDANSAWIGFKDSSNTSPYGTYTFTTTFDLTGYDPSTASLIGRWAMDQSGGLYLNGVLEQSVPDGNWNAGVNPTLTSFTISSGFVAGVNVLTFVGPFPDNFDGLRVEPMTLTATPSGVPDGGSTAMLLSISLAGMTWVRRKI